MREYVDNAAGVPVNTGKLLHQADGGMATWAMVKAQAESVFGMHLVDTDVNSIPMIAADVYGNFIPGPAHGLPQYVTETGLVEGDRSAPVPVPANIKSIHTAFLNDIAHSAAPKEQTATTGGPDADAVAGNSLDTPVCPVGITGCYDDELLNTHFIAGDGRTNENIGLTAVHQIFHSEHDRLVDYMKNVILTDTSGPDPLLSLSDWTVGARRCRTAAATSGEATASSRRLGS